MCQGRFFSMRTECEIVQPFRLAPYGSAAAQQRFGYPTPMCRRPVRGMKVPIGAAIRPRPLWPSNRAKGGHPVDGVAGPVAEETSCRPLTERE